MKKKTMTCKQLGGACDMPFTAETFKEIAAMSKKHGQDMFQKKDPAHLKAMNDMEVMMHSPGAVEAWYNEKKKEFDALWV